MSNVSGNHPGLGFVMTHWICWIQRKSFRKHSIVMVSSYIWAYAILIQIYNNFLIITAYLDNRLAHPLWSRRPGKSSVSNCIWVDMNSTHQEAYMTETMWNLMYTWHTQYQHKNHQSCNKCCYIRRSGWHWLDRHVVYIMVPKK